MTDMLVELIENFIGGSESTLNSLFNGMLNLVFFIERELMYIPEGTMFVKSRIDFNQIYQVVFNFATSLLVIVFITKAIKTYFLMRERRQRTKSNAISSWNVKSSYCNAMF